MEWFGSCPAWYGLYPTPLSVSWPGAATGSGWLQANDAAGGFPGRCTPAAEHPASKPVTATATTMGRMAARPARRKAQVVGERGDKPVTVGESKRPQLVPHY